MIAISFTNTPPIIRFKKKDYSQNDLLVASCVGANVYDLLSNDGVTIDVYLEKTCKLALYKLMLQLNPGFSDTKEWSSLFKFIADMYEPVYSERNKYIDSKLPYASKLSKDQRESLIMSFNSKHLYSTFEPGLGKSLVAVSLSDLYDYKCNVIVCKKTAKNSWLTEIMKWGTPREHVLVVGSKNPVNVKERYIILTHKSFKLKMKQLRSRAVDHLVIDEAHKIKNPRTDTFKATEDLITIKNPRVTYLSGTPQTNWTDDYFAPLKLSKHVLGKSFKQFKSLFCNIKNTPWGEKVVGGKNEELLNACLSNFFIRNTQSKRQVLGTGVYYNVITVPMEGYIAEYNQAVANMMKSGKDIAKIKTILISMLRFAALSKIPSAVEIIEDTTVEYKKKIIVFCTFVDVLTTLKQKFGDKAELIYGKTSDAKRVEALKRFAEDPLCMTLLLQTEAGGESIDGIQQVASNVLMVDIPIIPKNIEQPVARLDRIGQLEDVTCQFLCAENTVDEKVLKFVAAKELSKNKVMVGQSSTFNFNYSEFDITKLIIEDTDVEETITSYEGEE